MQRAHLFLFALLLSACAQALAPGEVVENLSFKDTWYLPRELKDLGDAKAYVFAFVREGCPEAEAAAPTLRTLEAKYGPQGIVFVAVDSWNDDNATHAAWFALRNEIFFPVVKDWDAKCANALGVDAAPTVAVLDAQRTLRYRGPVETHLADALDAVLAGQAVPTPEAKAEGCAVAAPPAEASGTVTYAEHIAPILERNCVTCHRPGNQGPFELNTYDSAAAHANMIAEVMREGRMPPWYAHPDFGKFLNDRSISPKDSALVRQWIAGGKAQGDTGPQAKAAHAEVAANLDANGFQIEPDLIVSQPGRSAVPATGVVPYQYVFLPHKFEEDTYIEGIEIKPDNPKVLHHGNLFYTREAYKVNQDTDFLTGTVPGGIPSVTQDGIAWRIPKGANLCLQLHLVTTGKIDSCKVSVGLRFARGKVDKLLYYHNFDDNTLELAPNERAHKVLKEYTLEDDVSSIGMFAHMHLRGKAMTFAARYPDGRREWLMALPNYSFDWQITYTIQPYRDRYPAGTVIECAGYWDNSRWNPYNPAPDTVVKQGAQTTDEMMNGFFVFTKDAEHLNLAIDPATGAAQQQVALAK